MIDLKLYKQFANALSVLDAPAEKILPEAVWFRDGKINRIVLTYGLYDLERAFDEAAKITSAYSEIRLEINGVIFAEDETAYWDERRQYEKEIAAYEEEEAGNEAVRNLL